MRGAGVRYSGVRWSETRDGCLDDGEMPYGGGEASAMSGTRPRVWALTAFVVLANVIGNLSLSWGMKHPLGMRVTGVEFLDALFQPYVGLGILLLATWTFSRITLLSWADLTFVLPVTSVGYVLNAAIGHVVYGEEVSWPRWIGTALILSGTVITGLTPARVDARR
jgi:uncharacterized membrane protein